MTKRIGRVTHEGRYVIIEVPGDWQPGDRLPPPTLDDRWFDTYLAFVTALRAPYDRRPIERQPLEAPHLALERWKRQLQLEGWATD